jgi:hypothetical protein
MQSERVDRRQFTIAAALAFLGGATIALGCAGGSKSPSGPGPIPSPAPGTGNLSGSVDANHAMPHVAIITAAQLGAGAGVTLDTSNGLHSHTVTIAAAQMGQLAAGVRVSVTSSRNPHSDGTGPHEHVVTFN